MASPYNKAQISQYLTLIGLPLAQHAAPPTLGFLTALHVHTISTFPYENLALHYDPSHTVNLDAQALFDKVVSRNCGRGGFCMELALLHNHVLCALGFDAYTAGVRTRLRIEAVPHGGYPGWAHIINIVTFEDGTRWYSDVGFGGDGPTKPLPLAENVVHANLGAQEVRLVRDWIDSQKHRTERSKLWIYQYRNGQEKEWNSFYAFDELEFMLPDWKVLTYWLCQHEESNQRKNVLVVKFLRRGGQDNAQKIYGKLMLVNSKVKRNLGGRTELVQECTTEAERIEALDKVFGISLSAEEVKAIRETETAL